MRNDNFNLFLEILTLLVFFVALGFVVLFALMTLLVVNNEIIDYSRERSESDLIVYRHRAYLMVYLMITIPAVIVILAGLGIRFLFLRPEPTSRVPPVREPLGDAPSGRPGGRRLAVPEAKPPGNGADGSSAPAGRRRP